VFFHFADLRPEHMLEKSFLRYAKDSYLIRFEYSVLAYYGQNGLSSKAVDIALIALQPLTH
jgi:hypothetical protein